MEFESFENFLDDEKRYSVNSSNLLSVFYHFN